LALAHGAEVLRVHEVLAARRALDVTEVILGRRRWDAAAMS